MNSINNILEFIQKNTDIKIKDIKQNEREECEKILEETKTLIKKQEEENKEKILNKKKEHESNFNVQLKQLKNKVIYSKKDEILKKTINLAIEEFCEQSDNVYRNFIEKLIYKNIQNEKYSLIFGIKDYYKLEYNLIQKVSNEIENVVEIKYSKDFNYGFKISSEKYILNFEIKNIFLENIQKLKTVASKALNMDGVL